MVHNKLLLVPIPPLHMAHYNMGIHIPLWKLVMLVTFALFANVTDVANLHGGILKANSTVSSIFIEISGMLNEIGKRLTYGYMTSMTRLIQREAVHLAPAPASSQSKRPLRPPPPARLQVRLS